MIRSIKICSSSEWCNSPQPQDKDEPGCWLISVAYHSAGPKKRPHGVGGYADVTDNAGEINHEGGQTGLIVTNGKSAVGAVRKAGIPGELLPWDDVLHDGPVPGGLGDAELAHVRAAYLADGADPGPIEAELRLRDRTLQEAKGRIVLWFEHDLYDQLQLIQILSRLSCRSDLWMVPQDTFITDLGPEALRTAFDQTVKVSEAQREWAVRAWAAFTAPRPDLMPELIQDPGIAALSHLAPALRRWLESFPSKGGLARTETEVLRLLSDGPKSGVALFRATDASEEAAFRGDWSFWKVLAGLSPGLLREEPDGLWSITGLGTQVLASARDRVSSIGLDSWRGGTHLTPENDWRWDGNRLRRR
ncbi:MAG: hypothetical protein ACI9BV_001331 [Rhodothermales bacterium]